MIASRRGLGGPWLTAVPLGWLRLATTVLTWVSTYCTDPVQPVCRPSMHQGGGRSKYLLRARSSGAATTRLTLAWSNRFMPLRVAS